MWGADILSENMYNHKNAEVRLVELIGIQNTKCGTLNQNDGRIWLRRHICIHQNIRIFPYLSNAV